MAGATECPGCKQMHFLDGKCGACGYPKAEAEESEKGKDEGK